MSTRMRVRSTRGIAVGILASLLVLSSFAGTSAQDERPLLGARRTGVEVMGDTVLDVTLPGAFVLSGKILTDDPASVLGSMVLARSGDQVFSGGFVMPALGPFVSLSGRITDERGQPVARASVSAFSDALADVPNAAFYASVEADAQGRYRLRLLRGTRYRIEICPPVASPLPFGSGVRRSSPF